MGNKTLTNAKRVRNDEFYTQYADIEKEVSAYLEHDPHIFRDKTLLLPCDDPELSNFTKYFADNFKSFGIKRLISSCYVKHGHGRKLVIESNTSTAECLKGDGDFRSEEVTKLRDESDIIVTNPPFSLFREFLAWINPSEKNFLIIGNMNAITYKEVFPLLKSNKIWTGNNSKVNGGAMLFEIPETIANLDQVRKIEERRGQEVFVTRVQGIRWFTNLEHGRRHQPLTLMTEADNLRYSKHKQIKGKSSYQHYDNYHAIEVPFVDSIPSDYKGVMGVPISFLDKYCPEQFEIVGATESEGKGFSEGLWDSNSKVSQPIIEGERIYKRLFIKHRMSGVTRYDRPYINGKRIYFRILIRHKTL